MKLLVLYDKNDFLVTYFEKVSQAAKFLGKPTDTIYKTMKRKGRFIEGYELLWIKV